MITGFEQYTKPLNEIELHRLVPAIEKQWKKKQFEEFVNMEDMIRAVNTYCKNNQIYNKSGKRFYTTDGSRVRQMIHYLRVSGKLADLIATSKGYFRTNDPKKIAKYIHSLIQRGNSFYEVANAMKSHHAEILKQEEK